VSTRRAAERAPDEASVTEESLDLAPSGLPGRLGANVLVNYVTVGVVALVGLVTTPILVHHLGTDAYGVWALVGSVVVYLELLELGVGATTTKLIAEDARRRDEAVIRTLNTNVLVLSVLGAAAIVVGLAIAGFAIGWFGVPARFHHAAYVSFVVMTVAVAVSIPLDALGGALTAYQRVDLLSISNLVRAVGAGVGGAVAALLGGGIVAVTVVTAFCGVSVHYLRWLMLARLIPGLRLSPKLVERPTLRATAQLSGWFMLRDATTVIVQRLDLVVVGVLLGVRDVAIYSIALKLSQIGVRALQPFTALFFPRASALSADRDDAGLARLLVDGTRVTLAVATPLTLVLALLARPALVAWVGNGFRDAVSVLVLLAVARGLASVTETAWWLLGGAGYIKWTSSLSLIEAAVNLGASIALAPVMGPAGVATGTLIGVVTARLPVALAVASRLTGMSTATFARRSLLPHLVPALLTSAVLVAAAALVPATPAAVVPVAALACLVYFAAYLAWGAQPDERASLRDAMRRPLRRTAAVPAQAAAPVETSTWTDTP
jgi:O-antigen/teichoic acid export membrane protein